MYKIYEIRNTHQVSNPIHVHKAYKRNYIKRHFVLISRNNKNTLLYEYPVRSCKIKGGSHYDLFSTGRFEWNKVISIFLLNLYCNHFLVPGFLW